MSDATMLAIDCWSKRQVNVRVWEERLVCGWAGKAISGGAGGRDFQMACDVSKHAPFDTLDGIADDACQGDYKGCNC
eukprot:3515407-Ditylum_brightwellii.AAC.2